MNIVLTQRCIFNLKSILHFLKLSKENIYGYYFIKLFLMIFNLKYKEGVNQSIAT